MEMVQVGGHFTQVNEANNYMGHGFWQFSPELIYRAFSPENGFRIETVLLHEVTPGGAWYSARDPKQIGCRVQLSNRKPTYILTIAKRMALVEVFAKPPQQSDYVAKWNGEVTEAPAQDVSWCRSRAKWMIPPFIRRAVKRSLQRFTRQPEFEERCYERIAERDLLLGKLPSRSEECLI
jgi:hypothetical protein